MIIKDEDIKFYLDKGYESIFRSDRIVLTKQINDYFIFLEMYYLENEIKIKFTFNRLKYFFFLDSGYFQHKHQDFDRIEKMFISYTKHLIDFIPEGF